MEPPTKEPIIMSRLARHIDILSGAATAHIAVVSDEGQNAWTRYHGELGNRLVGEGDLILDLDDVGAAADFVNRGILDRWAEAVDFSLDGIDRTEAFYALGITTLHEAFPAESPQQGSSEKFRLRVHRDFIITVLVEVFDGPFYESPGFWDAVGRRRGPNASRAPKR